MTTRGTFVDGLYVIDRPAQPSQEAGWSDGGASVVPTVGVVVLVHGAMDRAASFAKVDRCLGDLPVLRYDRRGYGRSQALGPGDIATHVDDLLDVIGDRTAVVVGHSLGGVVALAAAEHDPVNVRAVLAYEAPMSWQPWWPADSMGNAAMLSSDPADMAELFMRRAIGDSRWERLPPAYRDGRRAEGPALAADLRSAARAAPYDAQRIEVPVLVGYSTATRQRHRQAALELFRALPHAELATIEGADHAAHLTHAADFAALVRRTVALTSPPGRIAP